MRSTVKKCHTLGSLGSLLMTRSPKKTRWNIFQETLFSTGKKAKVSKNPWKRTGLCQKVFSKEWIELLTLTQWCNLSPLNSLPSPKLPITNLNLMKLRLQWWPKRSWRTTWGPKWIAHQEIAQLGQHLFTEWGRILIKRKLVLIGRGFSQKMKLLEKTPSKWLSLCDFSLQTVLFKENYDIFL